MQKLIVGLGNPGDGYKKTRHNVGFMIADCLQSTVDRNSEWVKKDKFKAEVCRPKAVDYILAKPITFMNDSGKAVSALSTFYKLHSTDIYIIHDDLDIKLGEYKIQKGIGPKDHNGVSSIEKSLGKTDFWRVRVGVENRPQAVEFLGFTIRKRLPGEAYVLQNLNKEELVIMNNTIANVVKDLIDKVLNND